MRKTISETAKMSGVSVRTLHYYDQIGLLKPDIVVPETGYRYYDEKSLIKLQQILFYRELDFPLKQIKEIIRMADSDENEVLGKQKKLLTLKRDRLNRLIDLLDHMMKGDNSMSFKEFDMREIEEAKEKYAQEAFEKWGHTEAYEQNQRKTATYKKEDWEKVRNEMDELLKEFADHRNESPESEVSGNLVGKWQQYITRNHYDCTCEILAGLGQMYVADERFQKEMDKFGEGTAKYMSEAIAAYCKAKTL